MRRRVLAGKLYLLGSASSLALAALAVAVASGCAAGGTNTEGGGGEPESGGAGPGSGGATAGPGGTGGTGGGTGGAGGGPTATEIDVCVLNEKGPKDACEASEKLDFGFVAAGSEETRLFRVDNPTGESLTFYEAKTDPPAFLIEALRYEADPGDPGSLLRVPETLPVTRKAGESLWFEVRFQADGEAGPLPADHLDLVTKLGSAAKETTAIPILGEKSGCPAGKAACDADPDNGCETDLSGSLEHCGACEKPCDPENGKGVCSGGKCELSACDAGFADCDGDGQSCESNLLNDPDTCGSCQTSCVTPNTTAACNGGNCAIVFCGEGHADCNLDAADGCETDVLQTLAHCGGCNLECDLPNAAEACEGGACKLGACDAGYEDCDKDPATGCEAHLLGDENHCGGCHVKCVFNHASGQCSDGSCQLGACDPGFESCNGNPNDGCEAELAADVENCGACGNDCEDLFPNSAVACNAGKCEQEACAPGHHDLNNDLSDGCEYACEKQSDSDAPDDGFVDANCDGVDGDADEAVFVAKSGLDSDAGTREAPMATVNGAIARALTTGKTQIYVSEGEYVGRVTLANGISIYGGYSRQNGWKRSTSYVATIRSATVSGGRVTAVDGADLSAPTTLDRLTIKTDGTTVLEASNYAFYCTGCSGVTLKNSVLEAGAAGAGRSGPSGAKGASGAKGGDGKNGTCDTNVDGGLGGTAGASTCSQTGGAGGQGGHAGKNSGKDGVSGVSASAWPGAGAGGPGGSGGDPGQKGQDGKGGANGTPGSNGSGGSGGQVTSGLWIGKAGGGGGQGTHGKGAGGGGGGGGQGGWAADDGAGNGGGGGGGGGCRGGIGAGGTAGGGSFGVFLVSSTGFVLLNNTISSGQGGSGGSGGSGGDGGLGGEGGLGAAYCTSQVGAGGKGGKGGSGGRGGHGGGGSGGVSYAVFRHATTLSVSGNTLTHGAGGLGGASLGLAGSAGASGDVF